MADSLLTFPGNNFTFSHILSPTMALTMGAVTAYIIDLDNPGTVLVAAGAGFSEPYLGPGGDGAFAKRIWYTWAVPSDFAGEAQYYLSAVVTPAGGGAETHTLEGTITVWPRTSYLSRYIIAMADWIQGSEIGERQANLGRRDYRRALSFALMAYNDAVTGAYTLSHVADTVPTAHRSALELYAAAIALIGPQAAGFLATATPEIAADFVNREPRSMSARALAWDWIKLALGQWGVGSTGSSASGSTGGSITPRPVGRPIPSAEYTAPT